MSSIRSLFISDTHLGSRHAEVDALLGFLRTVNRQSPPQFLYILGDFIDGWKFRRNWYWTDECNLVIRKILSMVKRGTQVRYITGNHDDFLRTFTKHFPLLDFGSVHLSDDYIHTTADGKKLLLIHGDQFDLAAKYAPWLVWLGDVGYEVLLRANVWWNVARKKMGMPYRSISRSMKSRVKQAVNYISDFETLMSKHAERRGCNGVVCGHIHHAEHRRINGVHYYNKGEWMESCTAVIERPDGVMEVIHDPRSFAVVEMSERQVDPSPGDGMILDPKG